LVVVNIAANAAHPIATAADRILLKLYLKYYIVQYIMIITLKLIISLSEVTTLIGILGAPHVPTYIYTKGGGGLPVAWGIWGPFIILYPNEY
jgi:hypothetical protein